MLKYTLLGFLQYQAMTGYELKQRMDRSTAHFWHAKLSQIYATLKTLEAEGLVFSTLEVQTERPDKRLYALTPQGLAEFKNWLAQPELELSPKKESLVLKLFFSGQLERETLLTQLRLQRDLHQQQVLYYREVTAAMVQQAAAEFPDLKKDALLWEATRRFGEEYEILYVRWLEECIGLVESQF
jgi:DNA-binding PadR family transcriptional regulator